MATLALNGLGRIGRIALRSLGAAQADLIGAVNDPASLEQVVQLLRHDSVHGQSALAIEGQTEGGQDYLLLGHRRVPLFHASDPAAILFPAATRLVLEVAGPTGQSGRGLAFLLSADPAKVSWATPPGGSGLVQSLAFDPGTGVPALVGKDKGGGVLQGAAFQKSGSPSFGQPLVRVCLELKSGSVPVNAAVPLAFTSGNTLSSAGTVSTLSLAVGGLAAQ